MDSTIFKRMYYGLFSAFVSNTSFSESLSIYSFSTNVNETFLPSLSTYVTG